MAIKDGKISCGKALKPAAEKIPPLF